MLYINQEYWLYQEKKFVQHVSIKSEEIIQFVPLNTKQNKQNISWFSILQGRPPLFQTELNPWFHELCLSSPNPPVMRSDAALDPCKLS